MKVGYERRQACGEAVGSTARRRQKAGLGKSMKAIDVKIKY